MVREHTWYGFKYFKIVWLLIYTKTWCILVRVLWILGWRVCELKFCKCPLDLLPQGVSFPRPWWISESPVSCWKLPTLSVDLSASLSAPLALVLRILRQGERMFLCVCVRSVRVCALSHSASCGCVPVSVHACMLGEAVHWVTMTCVCLCRYRLCIESQPEMRVRVCVFACLYVKGCSTWTPKLVWIRTFYWP